MLLKSGKHDALGELDEDDSDNEDADDVDDNEDEDEYDDENEDYGESDTEGADDEEYNGSTVEFNLNDLSQSFNNDTTHDSYASTVETFCDTPNPTATMFQAISDPDKVNAFRQYLASLDESEYLIYLAFTILKCSAISSVCPSALAVSDALFKDCFEFARKTNQMGRVKTFFLTQLGLLLNEDKTFKPVYDKSACRSAIQHSIHQKTFPGEVASMFELFLERF